MFESSIDDAVFPFEEALPDLETVPIAARRALDHAGIRLSLDSWRSLPTDDRRRLVLLGAAADVDIEAVLGSLQWAVPPPESSAVLGDADPHVPPEELLRALEPTRTIDPKRWARLRALDRYALVHTYRRAAAIRSFAILGEVFDAILGRERTSSPGPAAGKGPSNAPSSRPPPHLPRDPSSIPLPGFYSNVHVPSGPERDGRAEHRGERVDRGERADRGDRRDAPAHHPVSTHVGPEGDVRMVDIASKPATARRAVASGSVRMRRETVALVASQRAPKGEVLATARVAGILAAKRTPELIPLCHGVSMTRIAVDIDVDAATSRINVTATAEAFDRTGVEMEAMVAVSVACLTLYDMLKGVDRGMVIGDVKLLEKSGGQRGHYRREADSEPVAPPPPPPPPPPPSRAKDPPSRRGAEADPVVVRRTATTQPRPGGKGRS
jgi:cyclic pyranopterin monophosphate synthase